MPTPAGAAARDKGKGESREPAATPQRGGATTGCGREPSPPGNTRPAECSRLCAAEHGGFEAGMHARPPPPQPLPQPRQWQPRHCWEPCMPAPAQAILLQRRLVTPPPVLNARGIPCVPASTALRPQPRQKPSCLPSQPPSPSSPQAPSRRCNPSCECRLRVSSVVSSSRHHPMAPPPPPGRLLLRLRLLHVTRQSKVPHAKCWPAVHHPPTRATSVTRQYEV